MIAKAFGICHRCQNTIEPGQWVQAVRLEGERKARDAHVGCKPTRNERPPVIARKHRTAQTAKGVTP